MKKCFSHSPLPPFEIPSKNVADHRFYQLPDTGMWLPSVTTVLKGFNKQTLENWKKRVGVKAAKKIAEDASGRGDNVHDFIERYIKNEDVDSIRKGVTNNIQIKLFNQLKMECNRRVDNIRLQESCLFSETLGTAGRVDMVADYDNKLSLIDFKTSTNIKKEEYIESYKMQTSLYVKMIKEMYDIDIEQIVIMIACEKTPVCQTYVLDPHEYLNQSVNQVAKYYQQHGEFIVKVNANG